MTLVERLRDQSLVISHPERDRIADRIEQLEADSAALREDSERLDCIGKMLFNCQWNGVVDSGSKVTWRMVSDYRHKVAKMEGTTFRAAIDSVRKST